MYFLLFLFSSFIFFMYPLKKYLRNQQITDYSGILCFHVIILDFNTHSVLYLIYICFYVFLVKVRIKWSKTNMVNWNVAQVACRPFNIHLKLCNITQHSLRLIHLVDHSCHQHKVQDSLYFMNIPECFSVWT